MVYVSTVDGFNRLTIQNDSNSQNDGFAVGNFQLDTSVAGDPIDLSFGVDVIDEDGDTADGAIDVTVLPQLQGSADAEAIHATENGSVVLAGDGNDTIEGSGDADKLLGEGGNDTIRSEEHTSELQSLMRTS